MYSDSVSKSFWSPCFPTFRPLIMSTWSIAPIKTPTLMWGEHKGHHVHQCPYCGIPLLTGEHPGFCLVKMVNMCTKFPLCLPYPSNTVLLSLILKYHPSPVSLISYSPLHHWKPPINSHRSMDPLGFSQLKVVSITECARAIQTLLSIGFYMTASYVKKFHIRSGRH